MLGERREIRVPGMPEPIGHFAHVVKLIVEERGVPMLPLFSYILRCCLPGLIPTFARTGGLFFTCGASP